MQEQTQYLHVELRRGPRGERAFIAGHRIRVQDVVLWNNDGLSADEIVNRVPSLSLAEVHAVMAYYDAHREEVNQQMQEDDSFVNACELGLLGTDR